MIQFRPHESSSDPNDGRGECEYEYEESERDTDARPTESTICRTIRRLSVEIDEGAEGWGEMNIKEMSNVMDQNM